MPLSAQTGNVQWRLICGLKKQQNNNWLHRTHDITLYYTTNFNETLTRRAWAYCSTQQILNNELHTLVQHFTTNGFSEGFTRKIIGATINYLNNSLSSINNTKPPVSISLSYNCINFKISRILKPIGISVIFISNNKLRYNHKGFKFDKFDEFEGIVYKIPCSQCNKSYLGQSGKSLNVRISQHRYNCRVFNTDASQVARHMHESGHFPDFANARIMQLAPIRSIRSDLDDHVVGGRVARVRPTWSNRVEFVLACIGYAVGLGNIWKFPYLCFKNGGGAFLVPYFVMLLVCGIPLLFMELAVGQYTRLGPIGALEKICPLFKGAGLATVVISFLLCTYYNVLIAWVLFYLFNSCRDLLPWSHCKNKWNTELCWDKYANVSALSQPNNSKTPAQEFYDNKVLEMTDGIEHPGTMRWELVIALGVAWILVYFAVWKSIKSSGKVVYFTATLPYGLLIAFLVRSLTLEGSVNGLLYFFQPRWEQLFHVRIWVNAAAQNFNSIGVAFGSLIAFASYNKFNNDILRDTIIIALMDALTSVLAGMVIFTTIGHVAHRHNKNIDSIIADGSIQEPGIVFVIYPEIMTQMPLSQIWAIVFFILMLILGLDSQFAIVEVVITSLQDAFPTCIRRCCRRHEVLVFFVCLVAFACGLPNVTQGGIYFFQLIDYYAEAISLMYLAFFEVIAIVWFYGAGRLARNIQEMTGKLPALYFRLCWWIAAPLVILAIWVFRLIDYKPLTFNKVYHYPDWAEGLGWGIAFITSVCIPLLAINAVCRAPGRSLWEKLRNAIQPRLDDDLSENPGTSSYSLRTSGSRSSALPPEDAPVVRHPHHHELVKVEQIVSTV